MRARAVGVVLFVEHLDMVKEVFRDDGRVLDGIFYSFDETESWEKVFLSRRYLNQELLDRELARMV